MRRLHDSKGFQTQFSRLTRFISNSLPPSLFGIICWLQSSDCFCDRDRYGRKSCTQLQLKISQNTSFDHATGTAVMNTSHENFVFNIFTSIHCQKISSAIIFEKPSCLYLKVVQIQQFANSFNDSTMFYLVKWHLALLIPLSVHLQFKQKRFFLFAWYSIQLFTPTVVRRDAAICKMMKNEKLLARGML